MQSTARKSRHVLSEVETDFQISILLDMSSVFDDRCNKLICGFSEYTNVPTDIISIIKLFMRIEYITVNEVLYKGYEVIKDKFSSNVLSPDITRELRMNYISINDDNSMDSLKYSEVTLEVPKNHTKHVFVVW